MNTLFNFQAANTDTSQSRLFLIIGLHGISFTVLNNNKQLFETVVFISFDQAANVNKLATAMDKIIDIQPLLKNQFAQTDIVYTFTDSVLVPGEFLNNDVNERMLELLFGDAQEEMIKSDELPSMNLYNVYRVPTDLVSLLRGRFPSAKYRHLYSILPGLMKTETGNHIYTIFGTNHITAMLKKEGKLQVIQQFEYKTPEDVAYYLLNVCTSFGSPVNETIIHISGFLDKISTLYTEVYKFFKEIRFEELPEGYAYTDEIKKYPSHFFSHLFSLALCE